MKNTTTLGALLVPEVNVKAARDEIEKYYNHVGFDPKDGANEELLNNLALIIEGLVETDLIYSLSSIAPLEQAIAGPMGYLSELASESLRDGRTGTSAETAITIVGSSILSNGASYLIRRNRLKDNKGIKYITKEAAKDDSDIEKLEVALLSDGFATLDILKTRTAINEEQYEKFKATLQMYQSNFDRRMKISRGVAFASGLAAAYHGFKRNDNHIGYALAWSLTGVTGLGVALKQGFAKPIKK